MRLLLANPNTSAAITEAMAAVARAAARPGTEIVPVTASFGAAVIGTRSELAIAEHAALDLLARHASAADAAIVAASTDSGVRAARELLDIPVMGLTESALHVACLLGGRFGAVTLSARSLVFLREQVALHGLDRRCAGLRAAPATPQELLAQPDRVAALVAEQVAALVAQDGAESVVLVGAVLAPLLSRIQADAPVPVVEGVRCAVGLAETLAAMRLPKPRAGSFTPPGPRALTGMEGPLADMLRG